MGILISYSSSFSRIGRHHSIRLGVVRRATGILHLEISLEGSILLHPSMQDRRLLRHQHRSQSTEQILNALLMSNHLVTFGDGRKYSR